MPALLLSLLPYVLGVIAVASVSGWIRHQGTKSAEAKAEAKQEHVREVLEKKIDVAVSKDEAVDKKVEEQIEAIKKTTDVTRSGSHPGDTFKF